MILQEALKVGHEALQKYAPAMIHVCPVLNQIFHAISVLCSSQKPMHYWNSIGLVWYAVLEAHHLGINH